MSFKGIIRIISGNCCSDDLDDWKYTRNGENRDDDFEDTPSRGGWDKPTHVIDYADVGGHDES